MSLKLIVVLSLSLMTAGCHFPKAKGVESSYNRITGMTSTSCDLGNISALRPGAGRNGYTGFLSAWSLRLSFYAANSGDRIEEPKKVLMSFLSFSSDRDGGWVMLKWPRTLDLLINGSERFHFETNRRNSDSRTLMESMGTLVPWSLVVKMAEADTVEGELGLARFVLNEEERGILWDFVQLIKNGGQTVE